MDENNNWIWLENQIKKGNVKEAFYFRDLDRRRSDSDSWGNRYAVDVYLSVSEKETNSLRKKILISMYALDTEKSVYRFEVENEKFYEALFFIWSYFSSNNYNKRLDFHTIRYLMYDFGINHFYKDKPLNYNYETGYYEENVLNKSNIPRFNIDLSKLSLKL